MRRLTADSLKLGSTIAFLGGASLLGWAGLAALVSGRSLDPPPGFWADLSVIALGNLMLTAIVGLLAWVLTDKSGGHRRIDA